jgi:hypothetical protein
VGIALTSKGDYAKTEAYLTKVGKGDIFAGLSKYGSMGVQALAGATPTDTGRTAESWTFEVTASKGYAAIRWRNTNVDEGGVPVAVLIQYGHGTRTGGYVQGRDFINPAIRPIFDQIADAVWKEVTSG